MSRKYCQHDSGRTLVRNIWTNGTNAVWVRCDMCGNNTNGDGIWIPHDEVKKKGYIIEDLPIALDYRGTAGANCSYEGCENLDLELHHTAPKEKFGSVECEKYPKYYLCTKHHVIMTKAWRGQQ